MGWEYYARPIRVVDGDSIFLEVDLGFHVRKVLNCRLHGINTPELTSKDKAQKEKAQLAKSRLKDLVDAACGRGQGEHPLLIESFRDPQDKYGRWLVVLHANVMVDGGPDTTINQMLIDEGLATPYLV